MDNSNSYFTSLDGIFIWNMKQFQVTYLVFVKETKNKHVVLLEKSFCFQQRVYSNDRYTSLLPRPDHNIFPKT